MFPLWPTAASTMSDRVDALYIFLIAVTSAVTLMVLVLILVFIFKYRHTRHPVAEQVVGSLPLELTWSIVPFVIFVIFFAWGARIYVAEATPPKNSLEIYVIAKQWMWKLQHQNGVREINTLHVPMDRDVRLTMISQDVIHSFWIPEFRVKADVLPGRYTTIWFRANKTGTYHIHCAEYCGTLHSDMGGQVIVMTPNEYNHWLSGGGEMGSFAETGQKLFQSLGCTNCHRFDTQGRGPNLVGVYGKPVLLTDGRSVIADDAYVRESILNPGAKIVAGFRPIMPSFQGVLTEDQLLSVIAYIKSLAVSEQREPVSNRPPVPERSSGVEVQ
ncbi:MAG TPA: cytochrome c oxidase subunit II [Terriglobales bacterium]|nr:cytochrome c oxidase subunit II [Terriglobales bacterium]